MLSYKIIFSKQTKTDQHHILLNNLARKLGESLQDLCDQEGWKTYKVISMWFYDVFFILTQYSESKSFAVFLVTQGGQPNKINKPLASITGQFNAAG